MESYYNAYFNDIDSIYLLNKFKDNTEQPRSCVHVSTLLTKHNEFFTLRNNISRGNYDACIFLYHKISLKCSHLQIIVRCITKATGTALV